MNLKKRTSHRAFKTNHVWFLLLASPLLTSRVTGTPGVIANPTPTPILTPPAMESSVTNNPMQVFAPAGTGGDNSLPQPFQFGPVTLRPHVGYSFLYGNGIQVAPTNQQTTAIHQISPGLLLNLGTHWSLDYTPTIRLYSNNKFKDGVDHSLSLVGGTQYEDWTFGLSQSFLYTIAPTAETGSQTEQQLFGTALSASHSLNDKMSLDLGLNQSLAYADSLQNSRDWSTMDWLNYAFGPRLIVAAGAGVGYVNVDLGSDQTYESLQARVNWRATDKLSFQISGGGEDRQYSASSTADSLTPIFSGSIQYQPFEDTQISVNAGRSVAPSLFPGSDTTATSFGANLNQKLFKKFTLDLGAGYNISKFTEIKGVSFRGINYIYLQNRTDNNYSFNARLSHPLFRRGTWGIFYQYNDNQSTDAGFSYRSSQVGIDLSYRY